MSALENSVFIKIFKEIVIFLTYINDLVKSIVLYFVRCIKTCKSLKAQLTLYHAIASTYFYHKNKHE
jgi:hypothetical protein